MSVAYEKMKFPTLSEIRLQRMLRVLDTGEQPGKEWFVPNAMLPIFNRPARYRVCYGGRGGGRSWGFIRALLVKSLQKKLHILCAREFQNSIEESVHQLLSNQIELLGLSRYFDVKKREIVAYNGSDFVFAGLRTNVTKLQSFEGADICYIEEAAKISKDSWTKLIPTIRKPGSEIWASFNPDLSTDETYVKFIEKPMDVSELAIVLTTWRDNPWFTEELRKEKDYLQRVDLDAYTHVWDGGCRLNSVAQILRNKYVVEHFTPGADWHGPYYGVDWGFSQDPTTMVKCWVHGMNLYIEKEVWAIGCDIHKLPDLFDRVPGARQHTSRADNAYPATISYMQQHGYPNMTGCEKWPGSVEDGVMHLRSYAKIIIHPDCEHTIQEAQLYSYKVDKISGNVLTDIEDKHNHCIDALRYALGPMIKPGGAESFLSYMTQQQTEDKAKAEEAKKSSPNHIIEYVNLLGAKRS